MLSRLVLALALFPAALAQAQVSDLRLPEVANARALGMGGAYRATGLGAEATLGNPAALGLFKAYNADLTGAWDAASKAAFISTLVRDSVTSQLAAGVGYTILSEGHGAKRQTTNYTTLGLALPLAESFSLGVSGHYLSRKGLHAADAVTMDAGAIVRLGGVFTLGATANNLIDTKHPELPRSYGAEAALLAGAFNLAVDGRSELKKGAFNPTINTGLEYTIGNALPLRGGYTYEGSTKTSYLSVGAGFASEGSGVDFAYRQELKGPGRLLVMSFRGQF